MLHGGRSLKGKRFVRRYPCQCLWELCILEAVEADTARRPPDGCLVLSAEGYANSLMARGRGARYGTYLKTKDIKLSKPNQNTEDVKSAAKQTNISDLRSL